MKVKVSAKVVCSSFRKIFCTGYCELQTLFPGHMAQWYHAGVYGWNADYFADNARSILLVTGYRTGAATRGYAKETIDLPHDFVKGFEDKAHAFMRDSGHMKYAERAMKLAHLQEEFWEALDNYTTKEV